MRTASTLIIAAAVLAGTPLLAGPLAPVRVPADAAWILHVDMDQARATTLGTMLLEHTEEPRHDLDLDLDLEPGDVHDLTAFGWEEEDAGVIAVETTGAITRVVEQLREDATYQTFKAEGRSVHSWMLAGESDEAQQLYLTVIGSDDGRFVSYASDSMRALARALRTHDGLAPGCDDDGARIRTTPARGSIVYLSAAMPDELPGADAIAPIRDRADEFIIDLGEHDATAYLAVAVSAEDEEAAQNISDVLQGMSLIAGALIPDEPEMKPLRQSVRGMRFSPNGRVIHARCEIDARMLTGAGETPDAEPSPHELE